MAKSFTGKRKIKILLLEGLHPSSVEVLQAAGYTNIEYHKGSLPEDELLEAVKDAHFIGIRSRTNISQEVIDAAEKLVAVGCSVLVLTKLPQAAANAVSLFQCTVLNTRSVAELVLGQVLLLLRGIPEKNALAHRGIWKKSADNSYEARGKRLGIIGYGHIGTQLGIIAENLGMRVTFTTSKTSCLWVTQLKFIL
eukprot:TRINITY_DN1650_c0_g1_i1.p1 TRINITY_DN1650_c0_g1~~TRINITY_DN1650_c0_g1_i1.p1  ORF type:complete len:195 (-),score=40.70 TRINITY_DN1650_c0_g1_i1:572-1156(-)